MVFKFLSKPKTNIEIKSESQAVPGALLPVEIRIIAQEDIKAREVRAELLGEDTYYEKDTYRDSNGHISTRVVQKAGTIANIKQTVAEQPVLVKGAEQRWSASLPLPPEAPPTSHGKVVDIRWKIKAVVDVPNQRDQSQEMPLQVLRPPSENSNFNPYSGEQSFDDFTANLEVAQAASPGETLIGKLTLHMKDKLNAQGIRIELVQVEQAGDRDSSEVISKSEVCGSTSLGQNESPSFEFSLNIPPEAPPTAMSFHSNLRWKVKAVIARRFKRDFNMEREILVSNTSESRDK